MQPAELFDRLRAELTAAFAPPVCLACRAALTDANAQLCVDCRRALPWLAGPRCPRCALPAPCGPCCPARDAAFERAWAPLAHDGPARALVAALKFHGALPVAQLMAAQIAASAPRELLAEAVLVPVPLHPARRRARGFDQAALIAAALAQRSGRPVAMCLRRGGRPTRQLGADRSTRRAAAERQQLRICGPVPDHAVLVDDVHTTGATFDVCAHALRAAGARHVAAVAYARTLPRSAR
ncbi:MAG TPA: double zinc ribbon domain-containing protein [Conexibacter sp.]|jgi:predicted amidophosphoribosyltransferase|nr:double zinc ribbon domain-containing protein [Conexibacter sp.]